MAAVRCPTIQTVSLRIIALMLLVVLFVIVLQYSNIQSIANTDEFSVVRKKNKNDFVESTSKKNFFKIDNVVDCLNNHVDCTTIEDCADRCDSLGVTSSIQQGVSNQFTCDTNRNLCVPEVEVEAKTRVDCNNEHGIVALLKVNSYTRNVEWVCVSLYKDYFDDDGNQISTTCGAGSLDGVNILKSRRRPSFVDCSCDVDHHRMVNSMDIPLCSKSPWLFKRSYELK